MLNLPDGDGLFWQWYGGTWRLCHCEFFVGMGRYEFRWVDGKNWFRCYPGKFVRLVPPVKLEG